MNAAASPATSEPVLVPTLHTDLAPPFRAEWTRVVAPPPPGYTASAQLDPDDGQGVLTLKARPHAPNAPTTIGWFWAGWERRVDVQLATAFRVTVRCHRFTLRGGGICVPRCVVTLRPLEGGPEIYESVVLDPRSPWEASQSLVVVAPQSSRLPATVPYVLGVTLNLRAVYSKAQNPDAILDATIENVRRSFGFPTAADVSARAAGAADGVPADDGAPEDGDLDPAELAEALAALRRNDQAVAADSDR